MPEQTDLPEGGRLRHVKVEGSCYFQFWTMAGWWTCDLPYRHRGPHRSPLGNLVNDDGSPSASGEIGSEGRA